MGRQRNRATLYSEQEFQGVFTADRNQHGKQPGLGDELVIVWFKFESAVVALVETSSEFEAHEVSSLRQRKAIASTNWTEDSG